MSILIALVAWMMDSQWARFWNHPVGGIPKSGIVKLAVNLILGFEPTGMAATWAIIAAQSPQTFPTWGAAGVKMRRSPPEVEAEAALR